LPGDGFRSFRLPGGDGFLMNRSRLSGPVCRGAPCLRGDSVGGQPKTTMSWGDATMAEGNTVADSGVKFLDRLTSEDRRLLGESGRVSTLHKDAMILEEGSARQSLFIVLSGRVRVVRTHLGTSVTIATLDVGQIFGEMAYLEGIGSSASVFADLDGTKVLCLEASQVHTLLTSVPGLAVRFYESLALILSKRLRTTTAHIPELIIEEIAQVRPHPVEHTHSSDLSTLPPSLVAEVAKFKDGMAQCERALIKKAAQPREIQSVVSQACDSLNQALSRHVIRENKLADVIGAFVFRETFPFMMASRLMDRCLTKPRGYAGDFGTIAMIYDNEPSGDGRLGPLIDKWALNGGPPSAVRARRGTLLEYIKSAYGQWDRKFPMLITSVACGPAREIFDLYSGGTPTPRVETTCIDIDPQALESVAIKAKETGIEKFINLVCANVIRLILGARDVEIQPQHLVYSVGLMDYLQDRTVIAFLNWAYRILLPGGQVIIGNFITGNPDKAFLDYMMEWILIHRSADDLRSLFRQSLFRDAPVQVDVDPTGIQGFARCIKP
jgi:extracellular factor (EF) 3-hydroxypalmitic acid methyl ester biosynthesis protein